MTFSDFQIMLLNFLYIIRDFAEGLLDFLFTPQVIGDLGTITPIYPIFGSFAAVLLVRLLINTIFA